MQSLTWKLKLHWALELEALGNMGMWNVTDMALHSYNFTVSKINKQFSLELYLEAFWSKHLLKAGQFEDSSGCWKADITLHQSTLLVSRIFQFLDAQDSLYWINQENHRMSSLYPSVLSLTDCFMLKYNQTFLIPMEISNRFSKSIVLPYCEMGISKKKIKARNILQWWFLPHGFFLSPLP